jgi:hypothetical protein
MDYIVVFPPILVLDIGIVLVDILLIIALLLGKLYFALREDMKRMRMVAMSEGMEIC